MVWLPVPSSTAKVSGGVLREVGLQLSREAQGARYGQTSVTSDAQQRPSRDPAACNQSELERALSNADW